MLYPLRSFELGINDKTAANLIPDQAVVDAENVVFGKGFIFKRNGYVSYRKIGEPLVATWADVGAKKWSEV
jgi:hypothetical protein